MMKALFLYTELADYFLKCCGELSKTGEVHIIRWPVNKEAPFDFEYPENLKIYDKEKYNFEALEDLVKSISPDIIICSGWIDKDYLKLTRKYFLKIPTVLACDTQWKGSLRQYLAVALSRLFLLPVFSHSWVPGHKQVEYVRKLGFKDEKIKTGFYCCDLKKFNAIHLAQSSLKKSKFPKIFIYAGRYYAFKGITDLWEAFADLQTEEPNEWELWCLGTGTIDPVKHPKIKHLGFVQPADLEPILAQSGVFVLPSRFEPWGVVVQEYAAAGFPLLLSEATGAKDAFLEAGKNGHSFPSNNKNDLKKQLKKIIHLSDQELVLMGDKSHGLAQTITPQQWAQTVRDMYNGFEKK